MNFAPLKEAFDSLSVYPSGWLFPALLVALSLLAQAIFVGSEMALTALDRARLQELAKQDRRFSTLVDFLEAPTWVLGATLIGANTALAAFAATGIYALLPHLGKWSPGVVLLCLPLTLLFGDVLPKSIFQNRPLPLAIALIWPLRFLGLLFRPLLRALSSISQSLTQGGKRSPSEPLFVLREELKLRIQEESASPDLRPLERHMLTRIFDFSETRASQVMMPLIDVFTVADHSPLREAVTSLAEQGFSRFPVCRNRSDNIVGILYAFDILYEEDLSQPTGGFMRPALYVPETMPIPRLLLELRRKRVGMAIVVDEYGRAQGVVTLEDVLEEIVGDIEDEYDRQANKWQRVAPGEIRLNARMELQELEGLLGLHLPRGSYDTVAGLLLAAFGHIPQTGAIWRYEQLTFVVRSTSERAIQEVSVIDRRIKPTPTI